MKKLSEYFFRLNPECYLVPGKSSSVIYNLLTNEMLWLNKESTDKLINSELNNSINKKDTLFAELEQMDYGFFTDSRCFVDKIRTINSFNQKKMWKETPNINVAILQIINDCNLNCSFCGNAFCPSCTRFNNKAQKDILSLEDWLSVIDELSFFKVQSIMFTGGEIALYPYLKQLIEHALEKEINISIHTNGTIAIKNLPFEEINVIFSASTDEQLKSIINNYSFLGKATLCLLNSDNLSDNPDIPSTWKKLSVNINEPDIFKSNLDKIDLDKFFMRKLKNPCLNGKITIAYNGDIFPCFGYKESLMNLKCSSISNAVQVLSKDYWNTSVDKLGSKCTECEFRYSCNSCKLTDLSKKCHYNMEEGLWK